MSQNRAQVLAPNRTPGPEPTGNPLGSAGKRAEAGSGKSLQIVPIEVLILKIVVAPVRVRVSPFLENPANRGVLLVLAPAAEGARTPRELTRACLARALVGRQPDKQLCESGSDPARNALRKLP